MWIFRRLRKIEQDIDVLRTRQIIMQANQEKNDVLTLKFSNDSPHPDPTYAKEGDSGFDLRAWIQPNEDGVLCDSNNVYSIVLHPHERRLIHTGIRCELPHNTEIQVRPRSGNALKFGISLTNTPATIDELYRGEIGVIVLNTSNDIVTIQDGDRIAQAVLCPVYNSYNVNLEKIEHVDTDTARGEGGYGHTGTK
jgi:dUTP pyrophosphatase